VVVVAVEWGRGKRAGVLSDYTFAVRTDSWDLVTAGKAYSGLTDTEIASLTKWFLDHRLPPADWFNEGVVGSSVSTAGGLTFVGEGGGHFDALDTKTGERLGISKRRRRQCSSDQLHDRRHQYVAVAVGGNQQLGTPYGDAIFAFTLFDDGP
jgi:hypothetical protein